MGTALKVLFISLRADRSGGPRHLYDQLCSIKHGGATVEAFVAAPDGDAFSDDYKALSSQFFVLQHRSFSLLTAWRLLKLCRVEGIRLAHSHGRGAGLYSRFLHLFGIKVVHTFHGIHNDHGFKTRIKFYVDLMTRSLVDRYVCVSRSELERAVECGLSTRANAVLIENGIDLESIQAALQAPPHIDFASRCRLQPSTRLLGTVARNDPVKGVSLLVQYFSRFRQEHPEADLALLIAGGGYTATDANAVFYLGELDDTIGFSRALDIYVSNSQGEGMPISVLEAMACGTPCLLSRVTGHTDLMTNGETGYLFERGSFASFADQLLALLSSGGKQQAAAASQVVREHHSLASMSEKTIALYESCSATEELDVRMRSS